MEAPAFGTPVGALSTGRVFIDRLRPTSPGAGSALTIALDPTYLWRPLSIRFQLDTSASAANRWPTVDYTDPEGNVYLRNGIAKVFAANTVAQVCDFNYQRGAGEWVSGSDVLAPLADVFLPAGWQIRVNVANIQAADTITAVFCLFAKWVTGASENLGGATREQPTPAYW
jgi:hypothetical protein